MINLFNDDCLKVLKTLPDESVDLIVTDPPYKVTQRGNCGNMGGFWKTDLSRDGKIFENNDIECKDYLPELYRVLKDQSIAYIMINHINLIEMLNEATKVGFHFVKSLIWDKQSKICGRYYMSCFEYILLFRKGGDRPINDCSTPDILSVPIEKLKADDGNNLHDTEKPVELMKILIKNSSDVGQTVLDPFMGIGATGVAAVKLNRSFIGCEIDNKYFEVAQARINGDEYYETSRKSEIVKNSLF